MAIVDRTARHQQICRDVLEGAPRFILDYGIDGPWLDRMTRHYGYTSRKLAGVFDGKGQVIDFILSRHLADAFEAVCVPGDWCGPPVDVLRSMALALIAYGSDHLARHRVFLTEYERRPEGPRHAIAQQLVYLAYNFQVALHAARGTRKGTRSHGTASASPAAPTRASARECARLHEAASLLLGQLLHAPLWWPRDTSRAVTSTTLDAWVCTQIGLLAAIARPDHRKPSTATRRLAETAEAAVAPCQDWQFRMPERGGGDAEMLEPAC